MEITYLNLNTYLKQNKCNNACGHRTNNINYKDFEKIGGLYDSSYGNLSYLNFSSADETIEFIGTYPLQSCDVLKCKTCGQVIFFYLNDGGVAPRPAYLIADYEKEYLIEPAVKNVCINKENLTAFIDAFNLKMLKKPDKIPQGYHVKITDHNGRYTFNYKEFKNLTGDKVIFDLVAPRDFLRSVHLWLKEYDQDYK